MKKDWKQHRNSVYYSLGIPHPIEVGYGRAIGEGKSLGLAVGQIARNLRPGKGMSDLRASMTHAEMRYLATPKAQRPPFWGVSLGYQKLSLSGTKHTNLNYQEIEVPVDLKARVEVEAFYWTPQAGMHWEWESGFFYNFVVGVQIPFYAKSRVKAKFSEDPILDEAVKSTESYQKLEGDVEHLAERYGRLAIVLIKLVEIGWEF
ncbi:MAG: hypothetical protein AB7T49_10380 [Oligoflexales bacterium]